MSESDFSETLERRMEKRALDDYRELRRYVMSAFAVVALVVLFVVSIDWLWTRGTFCTDAIIEKDVADECETVAHSVENVSGSPILICRCKR